MRVSIFDAAPGACRFPVEGEGLDLIVCGAPAPEGSSYCPACRRVAYLPTPKPPRAACAYSRPTHSDERERAVDLVEALS